MPTSMINSATKYCVGVAKTIVKQGILKWKQLKAEVGEIFREAGTAFNKLSEIMTMLHFMADTQSGGKWTGEEIVMLRSCVHRFAVDLNKLTHHIKNRTFSQIRTTLKKKAFEEAGLPVRQINSIAPRSMRQPATQAVPSLSVIHGMLRHNAEVTSNTLNAPDNEVDGEDLTEGDVKLKFDESSDELVT